ncbi:hypothetical protein BC828DRAFT_13003 [Blastocladiella britannica]|nr:hypothetical protein BC828DRAFT_13003 [Blastocladiella britannica]
MVDDAIAVTANPENTKKMEVMIVDTFQNDDNVSDAPMDSDEEARIYAALSYASTAALVPIAAAPQRATIVSRTAATRSPVIINNIIKQNDNDSDDDDDDSRYSAPRSRHLENASAISAELANSSSSVIMIGSSDDDDDDEFDAGGAGNAQPPRKRARTEATSTPPPPPWRTDITPPWRMHAVEEVPNDDVKIQQSTTTAAEGELVLHIDETGVLAGESAAASAKAAREGEAATARDFKYLDNLRPLIRARYWIDENAGPTGPTRRWSDQGDRGSRRPDSVGANQQWDHLDGDMDLPCLRCLLQHKDKCRVMRCYACLKTNTHFTESCPLLTVPCRVCMRGDHTTNFCPLKFDDAANDDLCRECPPAFARHLTIQCPRTIHTYVLAPNAPNLIKLNSRLVCPMCADRHEVDSCSAWQRTNGIGHATAFSLANVADRQAHMIRPPPPPAEPPIELDDDGNMVVDDDQHVNAPEVVPIRTSQWVEIVDSDDEDAAARRHLPSSSGRSARVPPPTHSRGRGSQFQQQQQQRNGGEYDLRNTLPQRPSASGPSPPPPPHAVRSSTTSLRSDSRRTTTYDDRSSRYSSSRRDDRSISPNRNSSSSRYRDSRYDDDRRRDSREDDRYRDRPSSSTSSYRSGGGGGHPNPGSSNWQQMRAAHHPPGASGGSGPNRYSSGGGGGGGGGGRQSRPTIAPGGAGGSAPPPNFPRGGVSGGRGGGGGGHRISFASSRSGGGGGSR